MRYIEALESRTFLSADPGGTLATAMNTGALSTAKTFADSISPRDNDYYRFSVASTGNFNATLSGLRDDADIQLLDKRGRVIAESTRNGRSIERISTELNKGSYFMRVLAGTKRSKTTYTLRLQDDLNWGYAINAGKRQPVGLVRADGSTRPIDPNAETWIVVHGLTGQPDDLSMLSSALQKHSKQYQVLALDWSSPASLPLFAAFNWVPSVGQFVAKSLARWGIPGSKVDLVGHSMGGDIIGYVAQDVSGGVNRIVALDPATLWPLEHIDYAANSQYSLAFIGSSLSTPAAALTADATFHMNVGQFNSPLAHMAVADLFTSMVESNNTAHPDRVSALLSPEQLSPTASHPWKIDAYTGGYEGTIVGEESDGRWIPQSIEYKDAASGDVQTIPA